ncbi:MAG: kelch repeat-containing protein [Polyangiaceae bacterium]
MRKSAFMCAFAVSAIVTACGSSSSGTSSTAAGDEGGACYGNGSCNTGLTCASNLCVRLDSGSIPGDASDACGNVTCESPPATTCSDASTLTSYGKAGSCSAGACSYPKTDQKCAVVNATSSCADAKCAFTCKPGYSLCNGGASCCGDAILFGGYGGSSVLSDTWAFDGTNWTKLAPTTSPSARIPAAMATNGNRIVLFGGVGGKFNDTIFPDTWTFDGSNWSPVTTTASPSPRLLTSMSAVGSKTVLFGGTAMLDGSAALGDTWTFDGTNWAPLTLATSPTARSLTSMATLGTKAVLAGGNSTSQTWTFDGSSWSQPSATPPASISRVMAMLGGKLVLVATTVAGYTVASTTWTFDGTTWSMLSPAHSPPARESAAMAAVGGKIVFFGGNVEGVNYPPPLGDTWVFDGTDWTQLTPTTSPPARYSAVMATLP